jgi:hypothetical protein
MEEARLKMLRERERELERRRKEKQEFSKVMEDNERQREIKKQTKQRQMEEDIAFQKRYDELQEAQERGRQQALAEMGEKMKRKFEIALQVQKSVSEKASEDEARARREQDERERRAQDEQTAKEKRQHDEKERMKALLAKQMAEKEACGSRRGWCEC